MFHVHPVSSRHRLENKHVYILSNERYTEHVKTWSCSSSHPGVFVFFLVSAPKQMSSCFLICKCSAPSGVGLWKGCIVSLNGFAHRIRAEKPPHSCSSLALLHPAAPQTRCKGSRDKKTQRTTDATLERVYLVHFQFVHSRNQSIK